MQIPQFFSTRKNIIILNKLSRKNIIKNKLRIYLTRKNAFFRKLINEADLIDELKLKNFTIIDTDTLSIDEQINIFSSAEIIMSPQIPPYAGLLKASVIPLPPDPPPPAVTICPNVQVALPIKS